MNIKKILLIAVCILAVAGISVMGTLAYLTDSTAVVNTFTMGNVDITLDEADVDEYGVAIQGADRVTSNEYKLIPGMTYTKDPTVTVVKGSEESYVRMLVTMNCQKAINEIFDPQLQAETRLDAFFKGYDSSKWIYKGETTDTTADTITYEFRYYTTVSAADATENVKLEPLFTTFVAPGFLTGEDLKQLDDFEITVVGHAIQATGFEADTAAGTDAQDAAWAAFDAQVETTTNP